MPHMDGILKKMQPGIDKALKGTKHPEDMKTLEPKIHQVILSLQPEFEKDAKDTRPFVEVMKDLKHKINEDFKDLMVDLEKVWEDMGPGLDEAMEVLVAGLMMGAAVNAMTSYPNIIFPFLLGDAIGSSISVQERGKR
jgi:hypothetical protein